MNRPCGGDSADSTAVAISVNTAIASESWRSRLSTLTTDPSSVCTTDRVAVSFSMKSSAVVSYPIARPTAWASDAAACVAETSMTSSMPRAARVSRSAAASEWCVHVTPIDFR